MVRPKKTAEPPTHYQVLGVSPSISPELLHEHYKELALENHPDLFPLGSEEAGKATTRFASITAAYAVLRSPLRRAYYDERLKLLGLCCEPCAGKGTTERQTSFKTMAVKKTICPICNGTGRSKAR